MSSSKHLRFFEQYFFVLLRENGALTQAPANGVQFQKHLKKGSSSSSAPVFFFTPLRETGSINWFVPVFLLSLFLLCFSVIPVITDETFFIPESTLEIVAQQHGNEARKRLESWQQLITENEETEELAIIEKVNTFFNRLAFISDTLHWQQEDYWATPIEFLVTNGGDCEDFSIAKYFTLKALGIDEKKLNITYVKALKLNQAHMVLTFFQTPGSVPLVIDNLTNEVLPASRRTDLLPIYSFNGTGLWLAKQQGRGKMIGSSNRLKRWQETLTRMNNRSLPVNMRRP